MLYSVCLLSSRKTQTPDLCRVLRKKWCPGVRCDSRCCVNKRTSRDSSISNLTKVGSESVPFSLSAVQVSRILVRVRVNFHPCPPRSLFSSIHSPLSAFARGQGKDNKTSRKTKYMEKNEHKCKDRDRQQTLKNTNTNTNTNTETGKLSSSPSLPLHEGGWGRDEPSVAWEAAAWLVVPSGGYIWGSTYYGSTTMLVVLLEAQ